MRPSAVVIDFNSGRPQGWFSPRQIDNPQYIAELKRKLESQADSVLAYLWPNGRLNKGSKEYEVGSVRGEAGRSLKISLRSGKIGVGCDFAGGEITGDLIDCWAYARKGHKARGRDFAEVCEEIEQWLGLPFKPKAQISTKSESPEDLGPPTAVYNYTDVDGRILVVIKRFDPTDGKKTFRQWDATRNAHNMPAGNRPLYNLPKIAKEAVVVFVEGEKAADALAGLGIPATTAMGGSKADPSLTDWSPLAGKTFIIWPDADKPGAEYAETVAAAVAGAGGRPSILKLPAGKAEGWDAADAVAEGFDVVGLLNQEFQQPQPAATNLAASFSLQDWDSCRYTGKAPELRWLVKDVFPMASAGLLAARGGSGKSLLLLDLALKVVCRRQDTGLLQSRPTSFGGDVLEHGSVVIITCEDGSDEIHRRLVRLDPAGERLKSEHKLYVVPVAEAGGPWTLIGEGQQGPELTRTWSALVDQIAAIPDLKMIVFDPLSALVSVELNANEKAQFVLTAFSGLAYKTGALVLVAHHMAKGTAKTGVANPDVAREAIRGASALVDGGRFAYVMWPAEEPEARSILKRLDREFAYNLVYKGTIPKINVGPGIGVRTFVRNLSTGLLVDMSDALAKAGLPRDELKAMLVDFITKAAEDGHPFTATGTRGIYVKRARLNQDLAMCSRHKLESMVEELLADGAIVKAAHGSEKSAQWLDIPTGPFAKGVGEFAQGAEQ